MEEIKDLEKTLWIAADKLRSNMDAAKYKHVVLGLIFLKYVSDVFSGQYKKPGGAKDLSAADPGDRRWDAAHVFRVPVKARWTYLAARARLPEIGLLIDQAMDEIEKENDGLRGILPRHYADPDLDKGRLGELLELIGDIGFNGEGHKSKDLLGQVYEYFLGMFADAEGKNGGQFYTPQSIVKLLVELLEPYKGRIYDGCCGSGGMFVQSERFVEEHAGKLGDISIYGQESNPATVKLAKMNLAIRGIDATIHFGDTFTDDLHKGLQADYILANPPFNISDWKGERLRDDVRWKYGVPPASNANYAWLQHFVSKLAPGGTAGIVLANGSMISNMGGEGEIRKNMVDAGLIDCIVALPAQLFYNTMIPACLWVLSKNKQGGIFRDRAGEILFIDARKMGRLLNRRKRELMEGEIRMIADTYHGWRNPAGYYHDVAGFCKSATCEEIKNKDYLLLPGRYVGTQEEMTEDIPFEERMLALTASLSERFEKGIELQQIIKTKLAGLGYGS